MNLVPVNQPLVDGNELAYLKECIESGWISSEGQFIRRFEEGVAARMGRKYGIAVTNGTAALDAAVESLGIGAGDEVIVPAFTIISCVLQVVRAGATPILIDANPTTWNIEVDAIEERITPRTKAIMVVHIYGMPVDMDPVLDLCKRYSLKLIEDAAEQIGQTYRGKPCGSFGELSTLSFYPNKHITTGEGGMVLTDDDDLAEQCRALRNLCFQPGKRFVHERLGWNLRMTNLQAAVGVAQLERLDEFIEKKRWIGTRYDELLGEIPGIQLPLPKTDYADNIYWVYGIVLDEDHGSAESIMGKLSVAGIGTRPFFCPMNQQPALRAEGFFENEKCPVAERLYRQGLYLPSGLGLTIDQIERVARALKSILGGEG